MWVVAKDVRVGDFLATEEIVVKTTTIFNDIVPYLVEE